MIIATIGRQKFAMATLQDAEQLLHILDRSQPIDLEYNTEFGTYFYPERETDVGIEITRRELVSQDEHNARATKKLARLRAAEEAAAENRKAGADHA